MNDQIDEIPGPGVIKEIAAAYGLSLIAIIGFTQISAIIPWISNQLQWIVALVFVGIPWWYLKRKGLSWSDIGANRDSWWNYAKPALIMALVIFPIYVCGYHLAQTMLFERNFVHSRIDLWEEESSLTDLLIIGPKSLDKRPDEYHQSPLQIWEERDTVHLLWTLDKGEKFEGEVTTNGTVKNLAILSVKDNRLYKSPKQPRVKIKQLEDNSLNIASTHSAGLQIKIEQAKSFSLKGTINGKPISGHSVQLGEFGLRAEENGTWNFNRSYLWLLTILLMHILVVGVPEEIFYRGYIQGRLRQRFPDTWTLMGTPWGPSVIITSVLFALGHFLIELDPNRLIVFFPSLLFGWMMNRTQSIGSVAIFHGLCNVLLNIISRFYV